MPPHLRLVTPAAVPLRRDYIAYQTLDGGVAPGRWFSDLVQAETFRILDDRARRLEAALGRMLGEGSWTLRTNNTVPALAPNL